MKDFETNRDLDTYKKLLEVFPKGKMVPTNIWQVEMMHYPKQQQCCIDVLDQMESNGGHTFTFCTLLHLHTMKRTYGWIQFPSPLSLLSFNQIYLPSFSCLEANGS